MKIRITYKIALGCMISFMCFTTTAQNSRSLVTTSNLSETNKRQANYEKLKDLGYSDIEIFADLGNANFLMEKYETAIFWYHQLMESTDEGVLPSNYNKRYQYAVKKMGGMTVSNTSQRKEWLNQIKDEYQKNKRPHRSEYRELNFGRKNFVEDDVLVAHHPAPNGIRDKQNAASTSSSIALTADGKTAFLSKAIYVKPTYGIFSKKQLVHKIYKADKVDGEWKNIKQIALCPKNFSAMHPAVSEDGKRLFFASNMPGTYGEYDIYVSNINEDGNLSKARNLGAKVNTKKNDLHPNIVGGNTLFFASEGHDSYGGLDVFMAQIGTKKVGLAVNLGSPINSEEDDFSIALSEKGMGYVLSNRGDTDGNVRKVAFSYNQNKKPRSEKERDYNVLAAFNTDLKVNYSSTVFEDE